MRGRRALGNCSRKFRISYGISHFGTIRAKEIFSWLHQWKDPEDNLYWTGYVYPDKAFWPIEKPTWTAAAVLLAADTLYKFTDASELFLKDWSK